NILAIGRSSDVITKGDGASAAGISCCKINIQLAVSGCDVFVDGNIAISLQRQSRISTTGFIDICINSDVACLIRPGRSAVGQNSDTGSVVQLTVDTGIADLRLSGRARAEYFLTIFVGLMFCVTSSIMPPGLI